MKRLVLLCCMIISSSLDSMERSEGSLSAAELSRFGAITFPFSEHRTNYDPYEIYFLLSKYDWKLFTHGRLLPEEQEQYYHVLQQEALYVHTFTTIFLS